MWVASGQLDAYGNGAGDPGLVGAVGLGYVGGFHALDGWVAALFADVPLGTRTLRAELPSVLLLGLLAALLFVFVRRCLVKTSESPSWASVVAAIATTTVTCSAPLLDEGTRPGSSLLGVVLVVIALLVQDPRGRLSAAVGLFSLSLTYDPLVGLLVATVLVSRVALAPLQGPSPSMLRWTSALAALLTGAGPFLVAALEARTTRVSTSAPLFALPAFEPGSIRHVAAALQAELGEVLLLGSLAGVVLSLMTPRARRENGPLLLLTAVALSSLVVFGTSQEGWSSAGLVGLASCVALAAIAMQEAVLRVSRARLPLASASAAMVVVLFAAFPAILLDDSLARAATRPPLAVPFWEEAAFGGLPSGSLLLLPSPRLYARVLATLVMGDLPGDIGVLPTFDAKNEASAIALSHDLALVPLFRDIALVGTPQELSLSTLAVTRPLAVPTDPRWDRTLTRHLLPGGLLASFEPEPRGGADRKRALLATAASRARLATVLTSSGEPGLLSVTASLLSDRAVAAIETGEREVAALALGDAKAFAPNDPRIRQLLAKEQQRDTAVVMKAQLSRSTTRP
jgi:hypothetical protein